MSPSQSLGWCPGSFPEAPRGSKGLSELKADPELAEVRPPQVSSLASTRPPCPWGSLPSRVGKEPLGRGRKGEICIKMGICLKLHSFHPALVSFQFWTHEPALICIQLCTYWQTTLPGYYSLSISLPGCCSLLLSPDTQSVWGIISFFGLRSLRGFGEGHPNIFH